MTAPRVLRAVALRGIAILAVAALALPGCASKRSVEEGTTPVGHVVMVTPSQAGHTVVANVGDTVRIMLGAPLGGSLLGWRVQSYPRGILRLASTVPALAKFDFVATTAGQGSVVMVGLPRCGSAGPMAGGGPAAAGVQCPAVGEGGTSTSPPGSDGGLMPARQLTFVIHVSS